MILLRLSLTRQVLFTLFRRIDRHTPPPSRTGARPLAVALAFALAMSARTWTSGAPAAGPAQGGRMLLAESHDVLRDGSIRARLVRVVFREKRLSIVSPASPATGSASLAAVSPDGRSVVAWVRETANPLQDNRLWHGSLDIPALGLSPLAESVPFDRWPSWSGDGRHLAVSRVVEHGATGNVSLFSTGPDGGDPLRLTRPGSRFDMESVWSRGWIYFVRSSGITGVELPGGSGWLFRIRPNGSQLQRVLPGENSWPAASPDGRQLALIRQDRRGSSLYIFNLATRRLMRLAAPPGVTTPSWSSDGQFLAFSAGQTTRHRLEVFSLRTRRTTQLSVSRTSLLRPIFVPH